MSDAPQKPENLGTQSSQQISLLLRIGLWIAIIVHISVFLLFRVDSSYLPERERPKPYVTFVSEDSLAKDVELEEYAMLFDSAPLFIPTRWNTAQLVEVDFENVSLGPFPEFEPEIELLSELQPNGLWVTDYYKVDEPSDLLASRFWYFFEDFGRLSETVQAFKWASPVAEVSVIGTDRDSTILLEVDLNPATSFSVPRPVSYNLLKSDNGLVWGSPVLVESSDNYIFDQLVAEWLQSPDILAQLPVGYLSIRVFFW